MTRMTFLLSSMLMGCRIISEQDQLDALDPDGDGVLWWTDCDSQRADVGAADTLMLYPDEDGDGWGAADTRQSWPGSSCPTDKALADEGLSWLGLDCDDGDSERSPTLDEACDGKDNDCDGVIDEGGSCTVSGTRALTSDVLQVRGESAGARSGWALLGDVDFDGDAVMDVAIASAGAGGANDGTIHLLYGPLSSEEAFSSEQVRALDPADAQLGSASRSPDARTLASIELAEQTCLIVGAPQVEAEDIEAHGEVWLLVPDREPELAEITVLRELTSGFADVPDALGGALAAASANLSTPTMGFIAIGAPDTSVTGTGGDEVSAAGAVYLISSDGETLGETTAILGQEIGGHLGAALATTSPEANEDEAQRGDVDGDGCADLAVGAWPTTGPGEIALILGACELAEGEALLEDLVSVAFSGASTSDGFGSVLSMSPDLTDDGYADVLVGAPLASEGSAAGAGKAWLLRGAWNVTSSFHEPSATWVAAESTAALGSSLTDAGDLDADEHPDLAIGAPGGDGVAPDAGTAWLVYGPLPMSGATVDLTAGDLSVLRINGVQNLGEAGHALAPAGLAPDEKGDALLIGAPGADFGESDDGVAVGRVFLFTPD